MTTNTDPDTPTSRDDTLALIATVADGLDHSGTADAAHYNTGLRTVIASLAADLGRHDGADERGDTA